MKRANGSLRNTVFASLLSTVASTLVLIPQAELSAADNPTDKPNIIYILADDLGYGDLGRYGQRDIRTPQKNDVLARHPEVVKELAAAFDRWWAECLPLMVNEKAMGPAINPFQARYYAQFGGSPTPEDLKRMDPQGALTFGKKKR